ncbi:HEAT repeat-containing protein 5B-like protein, partial [Trifolium medium]|nr:HEAT repeat-containing protein 5B-like protein [Trifolium medium]
MHFKEVLLSMPPLHRQELQGVVRASVIHDKNQTEHKVPVLDIKMPKPVAGIEEKHPTPCAAVIHPDENNEEEHQETEEELQSSGLQEVASSISVNELDSCDQKSELEAEGSVEEDMLKQIVSDSPELQQGVSESDDNEQCYRGEEDVKKDNVDENESFDSKQGVSESPKSEVEAERSTEKDVPEQVVSDSPELQQGVLESDNIEQCNRCEDGKKDSVNENESHDSKQGTSKSPIENKHQEMQEELQSSELQEEALAIPESELVSCDQKP